MNLNHKHLHYPGEFIYKGVYWPPWYSLEIIKKIETSANFFPDDIIISTYAKSGTTLLQEIVWLIMNGADVEKAKKSHITARMPFIDLKLIWKIPPHDGKNYSVDILDHWSRPKIIKTHMPFRNLQHHLDNNPSMKTLIVFRNPKDTLVSTYHFYRAMRNFPEPKQESWETFFDRWMDGYIGGGNWLEMTKEWWLQKDRKNLKIVFYEDLVKKKYQSVSDISTFLNINMTEHQINKIVDHTDFNNMRSNPMTNFKNSEFFDPSFSFMRKGIVGDWKNWFTITQSETMDKMYNDTLEEIGLHFKYE